MAFLWLLHIKLALIAQQGVKMVKMLFSKAKLFRLIVFVIKICVFKKNSIVGRVPRVYTLHYHTLPCARWLKQSEDNFLNHNYSTNKFIRKTTKTKQFSERAEKINESIFIMQTLMYEREKLDKVVI